MIRAPCHEQGGEAEHSRDGIETAQKRVRKQSAYLARRQRTAVNRAVHEPAQHVRSGMFHSLGDPPVDIVEQRLEGVLAFCDIAVARHDLGDVVQHRAILARQFHDVQEHFERQLEPEVRDEVALALVTESVDQRRRKAPRKGRIACDGLWRQ